jgi:hypothetical protein
MNSLFNLNNNLTYLKLSSESKLLLLSLYLDIDYDNIDSNNNYITTIELKQIKAKYYLYSRIAFKKIKIFLDELSKNNFIKYNFDNSELTLLNIKKLNNDLNCENNQNNKDNKIHKCSCETSKNIINGKILQESISIAPERYINTLENTANGQKKDLTESLLYNTSNIYNNNIKNIYSVENENLQNQAVCNQNISENIKKHTKISKTDKINLKLDELEQNKDAVDVLNSFVEYRQFVNKQLDNDINRGLDGVINKQDVYYKYLDDIDNLLKRPVNGNPKPYTKQELIDIMDYCKQDNFWWANFVSISKLRTKPKPESNYKINTIFDSMKRYNYNLVNKNNNIKELKNEYEQPKPKDYTIPEKYRR